MAESKDTKCDRELSADTVAAFKYLSQNEDLRLDQRSVRGFESFSIGKSYHSSVRSGDKTTAEPKESDFPRLHPDVWAELFKAQPDEDDEMKVGIEIKSNGSDLDSMESNIWLDDHLLTVEAMEKRYDTSVLNGLAPDKASLRLKMARNILTPSQEGAAVRRFIAQMGEGFNPLLWVSAVLCLIAWYPLTYKTFDGVYNLALALFLFSAILLSALFGYYQEIQNSQLMNKTWMVAPQAKVRVRRGSPSWIQVDPSELVAGDVVSLQAGDSVPADIRMVDVQGAKAVCAALTGESGPVRLCVAATDENYHETRNLAFLGTSISEGSLIGIVCRTGDATLMGSITRMAMSTNTRTRSTLQAQISDFSLSIAIIGGCVGIATFLYWEVYFRTHREVSMPLAVMLANVIAVVVAFVPEGLPVCVTCSGSLYSSIMTRENVLVKRLSVVDTLGSISTLCSDKTGTLTHNIMTISHLALPSPPSPIAPVGSAAEQRPSRPAIAESPNRAFPFAGMAVASPSLVDATNVQTHAELAPQFRPLYNVAALCTRVSPNSASAADGDATVTAGVAESSDGGSEESDARRELQGDATEQAIYRFCDRLSKTMSPGSPPAGELRQLRPKLGEIPFNSRNKWQASVHGPLPESSWCPKLVLVVKGAPEQVIDFCSTSLTDSPMSGLTAGQLWREVVLCQAQRLGSLGERVLGFAFKELDAKDLGGDEVDAQSILRLMRGMTFAGLASLSDPPRPELPSTIAICRRAGIRTVMVTGDSPATAAAVARSVGIFSGSGVVMTGRDILSLGRCLPHLQPGTVQLPAMLIAGEDFPYLEEVHWNFILAANELVFARTTPAMKLEIAKKIKASGQRVAMTGDGVNDAPAMREADVGIAMGMSGTNVCKDMASIVILDDNFASIVRGIERGRLVFENLKKVIAYLLPAGCFSEWWALFGSVFLGMPLPMSAFQMLTASLTIDVVGSVSLVYEAPECDLMRQPPRDVKKEKLVDMRLLLYSYLQLGLWDAAVQYAMYFLAMWEFSDRRVAPGKLLFAWDHWTAPEDYAGLTLQERMCLLNYGQSAFFVALVMNQMWNVATMTRTRRNSLFSQPKNSATIISVGLQLWIVACVTWVTPINRLFNTAPLPLKYFGYPLVATSVNFMLQELVKLGRRRHSWMEFIFGW